MATAGEDSISTEDKAVMAKSVSDSDNAVGFPLFHLPPELRNLVYEKLAETRTAYLANGRLDDGSGLLSAGTELHNEYLPVLLLYASSIRAEVLNFDFRDITYSINRVSTAQLKFLSCTSRPTRQQLHIHVEVNNSPNVNAHLLFRWLKRAARRRNQGAELDVSYSLEYTYTLDPFRHPNFNAHFSKQGLLSKWAGKLDSFLEHAKEGKAKFEAEKIRALFDGLI